MFYFLGKKVHAQEQAIPYMRCTPVQLTGAQTYDVNLKRFVTQQRKMLINRCEGEDVICFHSYDQAGLFSCIKK